MIDEITLLYEPFYEFSEVEEVQRRLLDRLEKMGEDRRGVQFCVVHHPEVQTYLCILTRVVNDNVEENK